VYAGLSTGTMTASRPSSETRQLTYGLTMSRTIKTITPFKQRAQKFVDVTQITSVMMQDNRNIN
jgi:hypothetical protein